MTQEPIAPEVRCPVCSRAAAPPLPGCPEPRDALVSLVRASLPGWQPDEGLCPPCLNLFRAAEARLATGGHIFRDGAYRILPTPLRVAADGRFAGRGVTIAFLDCGFYPHPDLTLPADRVLHYVNITRPRADARADAEEFRTPNASSWHGMMTSVVAAGNGYLSGGIYRGLAAEACVVLVKVGTASRIHHDDIRRGLDWVVAHREEFDIRVVNVSCGGDYEASYHTDALSQAAEAAVRAGLVVVCAAGNSGQAPRHAVLPPASAPSVITVGGLNDQNVTDPARGEMYQSSYGPTIDGLQKPEVIAPSIWLAAPILPGTPTSAEAALLEELQAVPDSGLRDLLVAHAGVDAELDAARELPPYLIRHLIAIKIHDANVISGHYKHVDGTSFAAPIVASLVAQMLEANPRLSPPEVKEILTRSAVRLPDVPVERQGWGAVKPERALSAVISDSKFET